MPGSTTRATGVGLAVHSRYVLGEDRMVQFHRDGSRWARGGAFALVSHGSAFSPNGRTDTGVNPEPRRWYRLKVRTEVLADRLRVRAKAWPLDEPEPRSWQADAENRSSRRAVAGTVGFWASGGGAAVYRNLRVVSNDGRVLLDAPLVLPGGSSKPLGFREGTRGTRIEMALARSPRVPTGTPVVILSHMPDVVREAAWRGIPAVLAGHTHGGQIRLPFLGALTTRCSLGPYYDRGRFEFAGPERAGMDDAVHQLGSGDVGAAGALRVSAAVGAVRVGIMILELELDDSLVAEAMGVSGIQDLDALIAESLRVLIAAKRRKSLLDLDGKVEFAPGYDPKELR